MVDGRAASIRARRSTSSASLNTQHSTSLPTRRKSPPKRKRKTPKRGYRLPVSSARALPALASHWAPWRNNLLSVFLIPVAWVFTAALFTSFHRATTQHGFGSAVEFQFFSVGVVAWTLFFLGTMWIFGEPRLLRVYVFGHELTHAFWAWALGGKIYRFKATREGGYIETDRTNFWIALTPYFHPLYPILIIELYGAASLFYDMSGYTPLLFGSLGLTWAFHSSFTLWMIPKGQSDLTSHGTIFSLLVIYLMNIITLAALLIFSAPEVTFRAFGDELGRHTVAVVSFLMNAFDAVLHRGG